MTDDSNNRPPAKGGDPIERLTQDSRLERYPKAGNSAVDWDQLDIIRGNIKKWLEHQNTTNAQLARMAGVSPSALSEVLRGNYKGDSGSILHKAEAVISDWYDRRSAPAGKHFVMTRIAREIFAVVKATSKHRGIGIVTGPSGIGKSKTLAAVVRSDFPNAILIEVNVGCASPLNILRAVLHGARRAMGSIALRNRGSTENVYNREEAFNQIVARLAGSGRLLIVDEADNLRNEIFNLIRQLHDATDCPVVLVGRPLLHKKIERTMRDESIGGSLVGRICVEHQLKPKATGGSGDHWLFTDDEIIAMLESYKIRYTADAARWLCALANISSLDGQREGGALRYATKVLQMAITISQTNQITTEILKQANTLLRGKDWADLADRMAAEFVKLGKVAS